MRLSFAILAAGLLATAPAAAQLVVPVAASCISSAYGPRIIPNLPAAGTYHNGVDLPVSLGSPVYAAAAGHLLRIQDTGPGGLEILVQHAGFIGVYAHLGSTTLPIRLLARIRTPTPSSRLTLTDDDSATIRERPEGASDPFIDEVSRSTSIGPRTRSACTTEGNHAFCLGSFCRINRVIISCAYHNDRSHMYSGLRAPERRFGARRGRHSLDVVKQAAPTYQMLPALRPRAKRQCRRVSSIAIARSDFGPSLDRSASGRRGMKSAQAVLNPRELTRFGFVLPNSWIRLRRQLHTIIGRDHTGSAGRL